MNSAYEPHWTNYLQQFDISANAFQKIPKVGETNKYCVIVEPRQHPLLVPVIKNFMFLLQDSGWGLLIFHGKENKEYIQKGLVGWDPLTYKMIQMNVSNLTIPAYNGLMKSVSFWKTLKDIGCKHALTFETDAILLRGDVDRFLEWDYIGAPWRQPDCRWFGCLEVGNGGFCLRRVDAMYEIVTHPTFRFNCMTHDGYFGMACLKLGYKIPSIPIAMEFAAETIFHPSPCGLHKPHLNVFPDGEFARMLSVRHVTCHHKN